MSEEHIVTQIDRTREHLIETYRKKAKHYDITSRLYPAPGYPQRAVEIPSGPANATWLGGSTAVTSWLRRRLIPRISFARCSTREPG